MKTPRREAALSQTDLHAMVRLLGEVVATDDEHTTKKRYLLDGLSKLIDATAWVWGLFLQPEPGQQPVYLSFLHGGFDKERFALFLKALDHPDLAYFTAPFFMELQRRKAHTTRVRQQSDPENRFAASAAYPLWCEAGVVPGILSSRPVGQNSFSTVGLYRRPDQLPFSQRELRLAHIILSEVPWLHEEGRPGSHELTVPLLSLRQRQTLNLLIQGQKRKQIAEGMGISMHTLDGYVKQLYRHFRVHSHAELLRRFRHGDGGDSPMD